MITCVTCYYKSKDKEDFVYITIASPETVKESPVCQGCYDNYMMEVEAVRHEQREVVSAQATAFANVINTDYLE